MRKRILPIVLGLLLALSLIGNLLIYQQSREYYIDQSAVRLDPVGLNTTWPDFKADGRPIAIFFGDSRAEMWPNPNVGRWQFLNRGIGNQTSAQVLARFDAHVAAYQPQLVIIQVCINDLKAIPLFPDRKDDITENCVKNIGAMIQHARAINAQVIVTTIFPLGDIPLARRLVWSSDVAEAIARVNTQISALAGPDVFVFDSVPVLVDERGFVQHQYQFDFLHLNPDGYAALNKELTKLLTGLPAPK